MTLVLTFLLWKAVLGRVIHSLFMYFITAVETFAIAIRQKETIKGITIGTDETKLLQFADDTTAVLADTSSAERLFELLNPFEILSGLKINGSKTERMWIGSKRHYKEKTIRY